MPASPAPLSPDPAATDRLYRAFHQAVAGFVRRRVPPSDADDVAQEVFLRLHRAAPSLRDASRAQAFVLGIARRTVADYHRRRRPTGTPLDDAPEPHASPDDVHEEVLSWLIPMIALLPEPGRTALRLADVEGRSMAEVAAHFDLSVSGAKSRVQRARKALGDVLAACCAVEFGAEGRAVGYVSVQPAASVRATAPARAAEPVQPAALVQPAEPRCDGSCEKARGAASTCPSARLLG